MGSQARALDPGGPGEAGGAGGGAGPPATAEEYLRAVMREARALPEVLRAPGPPPGGGGGGGGAPGAAGAKTGGGLPGELPAAPSGAEPSVRWARDFLGSFAALRARLEAARDSGGSSRGGRRGALPARGDEEGWRTLCFHGEGEGVLGQDQLEVVLELDDPTATWLLECHAGWACAETSGVLGESQARWLYALAARVPEPLTGGTSAALRQLTRHLAEARAACRQASSTDPLIPRLNVLLAVTGGHFRQDGELVQRLHARLVRQQSVSQQAAR